MQTMQVQKIVPAVGSKVSGPLGAVHLPRLWTKLLLASRGMLPEGYDECGDGFDAMTLAALGLDRNDVIAFVRSEQPTYMAFETWIAHKSRAALDPAKIEAHNRAILAYDHANETARTMRADSGVTNASIGDAATLNALDDFDQLHAAIVATRT